MIKLKRLQFSNCLPFGENIVIDLDRSTTTQLIGANGSGKSSIPLILEELLYNKNSKGAAKGDILNRYSDNKTYHMNLLFSVDEVEYQISKEVKSTAKVELLRDGGDISGHTTTQTYKLLSDILGMDMVTFSKLVYQSLTSSLDFLTATDGNRKKFLISLLNLEKYSKVETKLKEVFKDVKADLIKEEETVRNLRNIISKMPVLDIVEKIEVPVLDPILTDKAEELTTEIANIQNSISTVKERLVSWSKEKELQELKLLEWENTKTALERFQLDVSSNSDVETHLTMLQLGAEDCSSHIVGLKKLSTELDTKIVDESSKLQNVSWEMDSVKKAYQTFNSDAEKTECTLCGTHLDKAHSKNEAAKQKQKFLSLRSDRDRLSEGLAELQSAKGVCISELNLLERELKSNKEKINKHKETLLYLSGEGARLASKLGVSSDELLSTKPMINLLSTKPMVNLEKPKDSDKEELESRLLKYQKDKLDNTLQIDSIRKNIERAKEHNTAAEANNKYREKTLETIESTSKDINEAKVRIVKLTKTESNMATLLKIFGPKGLIAYKLESCVKVFEDKVNQYLSQISNGMFALGFELEEANLKVIIYSSGKQVNIKTLSSGELSKVNISTLLAIRCLMSAVSKNSLNVLFLDEVVSTLDKNGMEDLISVLIQEDTLNTFVVSHNYQHPLVDVLRIIKEENISRIQHGN